MLGFDASPQVRLHPHDLLLLLPDDAAQAGQQRAVVAPRLWSQAVVETRQLVQQRLLTLGAGQQLLLRLAATLQLGPAEWNKRTSVQTSAHVVQF